MQFKRSLTLSISLLYLCFYVALNAQSSQDSARVEQLETQLVKSYYTDFDQTMRYLDSVEILAQSITWKDKKIEALIAKVQCSNYHYEMASYYHNLLRVDSAIATIEGDTKEAFWITNQVYWGNYFYKIKNYDKALGAFYELINILGALPDPTSKQIRRLGVSHQYIGSIYKQRGQYDESIENHLQSLRYSRIIEKEDRYNAAIGLNYAHIARSYQAKGDYATALKYYLDALVEQKLSFKLLEQKRSILKNRIISTYNGLADLYEVKGQIDSSLFYLNESLNYHDKDDPFLMNTYHKLGQIYRSQQKWSEAQKYLNLSLQLKEKAYKNETSTLAITNAELGKVHASRKDYDLALEYYQEAISNVTNDNTIAATTDNPRLQNLYLKKELLEILDLKSVALFDRYQQSKNTADMELAWLTSQLAISLMDSIRIDFNSDYDKQYLFDQSYAIFERGLEIAHDIYMTTKDEAYLEQAWQIAEKGKATLLLEARKNAAARYAQLPNELIEKEFQLRFELSHWESRLHKEKTKKNRKEKLSNYQQKIFDLKKEYQQFVSSLEQDYPDYFRLKYDIFSVNPSDIQRDLLDEEETLVEYFVGDKDLYIFTISKDDFFCLKKKKPTNFNSSIKELRQALSDTKWRLTNEDQAAAQYQKNATLLFDVLLKDVLTLQKETTKLILIPDAILGYVPFEVLLTNSTSTNSIADLPYLLKKYNISYAYSATLLKEQMQNSNKKATQLFGGFAPDYDKIASENQEVLALVRAGEYQLEGAINEVESISQLLNGRAYLSEAANEYTFKKEAANYKILHLAMHSLLDDLNPMYSNLLFTPNATDTLEDNQLNAAELYNLSLNAELVVLSACNTGYGQLSRGEGIMSLSRAFSYAGVSSTIMSLWKVPDKATSKIMLQFYENLQAGQQKDEALRNAKLSYLEETAIPEMQHPYYWAGFIPAGEMAAIDFPSSFQWYYYLIGGVLLIGLFFFFRQR